MALTVSSRPPCVVEEEESLEEEEEEEEDRGEAGKEKGVEGRNGEGGGPLPSGHLFERHLLNSYCILNLALWEHRR